MNQSYENDLLHTELEQVSQLPVSFSFNETHHPLLMDYDDRIQIFQMLIQSMLFSNHPVQLNDLTYWFPDCVDSSIVPLLISKETILTSLECLIALLMEGDLRSL